jgi:hypothetical protein
MKRKRIKTEGRAERRKERKKRNKIHERYKRMLLKAVYYMCNIFTTVTT